MGLIAIRGDPQRVLQAQLIVLTWQVRHYVTRCVDMEGGRTACGATLWYRIPCGTRISVRTLFEADSSQLPKCVAAGMTIHNGPMVVPARLVKSPHGPGMHAMVVPAGLGNPHRLSDGTFSRTLGAPWPIKVDFHSSGLNGRIIEDGSVPSDAVALLPASEWVTLKVPYNLSYDDLNEWYEDSKAVWTDTN